MSEHITHIAVCEDTIRLCLHAKNLHEDLINSLIKYPDIAIICSGSRGNHLFAVPFLEKVRGSEGSIDHAEKLLAAALGWLTHRAADLQMKPLSADEIEINDPMFSHDENEIYQDVMSFVNVYDQGRAESLSPYVHFSEATLAYRMESHPANELIDAGMVEDLFVAMVQQNLMTFRKVNSSSDNLEEWLDQFNDNYQDLSENLDSYLEAYTQPNARKMRHYIEDVNWYNAEDQIIQLVQALKQDKTTEISLQEALSIAENQSQYAQALAKAFLFVSKGSEFYEGKIDKNTLYDTVENIYKPHRL